MRRPNAAAAPATRSPPPYWAPAAIMVAAAALEEEVEAESVAEVPAEVVFALPLDEEAVVEVDSGVNLVGSR